MLACDLGLAATLNRLTAQNAISSIMTVLQVQKKKNLITTNRTNLCKFLNPVISFFSDRGSIFARTVPLFTQCDTILNE